MQVHVTNDVLLRQFALCQRSFASFCGALKQVTVEIQRSFSIPRATGCFGAGCDIVCIATRAWEEESGDTLKRSLREGAFFFLHSYWEEEK